MANGFIGRRESVGIALETVSGTPNTAQTYYPHMALTLDQKTNTVENTSALGRIEQTNDSQVVEEWSEGSLNGKVFGKSFGYLLANMFGTVTPTLRAGETTVWENLFTVNQNSAAIPSMTLTRLNPVAPRQYPFVMQSDMEMSVNAQEWVMFNSTVQGKIGTATSGTPTYIANEPEFTSKDVTLKVAGNLAGLTGATAIDFKSIKLKISRKLERYTPVGGIDPTAFDTDAFTVTGTITARYTDTVLENIALANTQQALSLTIANQAVTIGSSTKPSLTFTLPKIRFDPQALDNKLDQVLTQTFNFTGQLDMTAGYLIQAVLTSTNNGYARV